MRVDRIYRFGAWEPQKPEERALALQMLGLAHLYGDDLRRAYNEQKRWERAIRSGLAESTHVRAYEAHLAEVDEIGHVFAFEKAVMWQEVKDQKNERVRAVRARRGALLDHGTYWLVEEQFTAAAADSGLDPIRKRDWDQTGRIGAAIASTERFPAVPEFEPSATIEADTMWDHPRVRLSTLTDLWTKGGTVSRKKAGCGELTIVVGPRARKGSGEVDKSITWPVRMHRPFPVDAIVKRVAMLRVRVGQRFRWKLLVTVNYEDTCTDMPVSTEGLAAAASSGPSVVGIDLGWRREKPPAEGGERYFPAGQQNAIDVRSGPPMRVATWNGQTGESVDAGAIVSDALSLFTYADAVHGTRDDHFNLVKEYIKKEQLPGWQHVHAWKSKDRVRRLAAKLPMDLGLAMWCARDKHLEDIESARRALAIDRRKDLMRSTAARLARRYRYVALEDMAMSKFVGKAETHSAERRRSMASLAEWQKTLAARFGPERTVWVPAALTTMTCSACAHVREKPVGVAARWTCDGCGADHHQDENAAIVIRQWAEQWLVQGKPPRARTKITAVKGKGKAQAIATGTEERMVVRPKESLEHAAE